MQSRLLVVDDGHAARAVAGRILQSHYDVEFAADAIEARLKMMRGSFDLLLCDIHLPGESGMELMTSLLSGHEDDVAVVMVTAEDNPATADRAFELGAYGYLVKPYRRGDLLITVSNALHRRQLEQQSRAYQRELKQDVITKSLETEHVRALLRRSEEALERSRLETVHKLSLAVEMRDQVTGHHLSRMGAYCEEIARRMHLPEEVCDIISLAAQMHDIGKVAIPDRILLKRGPLTEDERAVVETHAEIGKQILQGSESPIMSLAEAIAWTHHEKVDGSGYPRGLEAADLDLDTRILPVCDVYDALISTRVYRAAWSAEKALGLLFEQAGSAFDDRVVNALARVLSREPASPLRQAV
jgi:putative two-component system response regulator